MADDRDDENDEGGAANLESLGAKWTAPVDRTLAEVRDEYLRLDGDARQAFRRWVEQLASTDPLVLHAPPVMATAKVELSIQDDPQSSRRLTVSVGTLRNALQAWDQGHEYLSDMGES